MVLISIEGVDGTGKSTICEWLRGYLNDKCIIHCFTKEPSDECRKLIQLTEKSDCNNISQLRGELYIYDRKHHQILIKSRLSENIVVVSDRYIDSQYAYNYYNGAFTIDELKEKQSDCIIPDLTILLIAPIEVLKQRILKRDSKDLNDFNINKLITVQENYLKLYNENPERFIICSSNVSLESLVNYLGNIIVNFVKEHSFVQEHKKIIIKSDNNNLQNFIDLSTNSRFEHPKRQLGHIEQKIIKNIEDNVKISFGYWIPKYKKCLKDLHYMGPDHYIRSARLFAGFKAYKKNHNNRMPESINDLFLSYNDMSVKSSHREVEEFLMFIRQVYKNLGTARKYVVAINNFYRFLYENNAIDVQIHIGTNNGYLENKRIYNYKITD